MTQPPPPGDWPPPGPVGPPPVPGPVPGSAPGPGPYGGYPQRPPYPGGPQQPPQGPGGPPPQGPPPGGPGAGPQGPGGPQYPPTGPQPQYPPTGPQPQYPPTGPQPQYPRTGPLPGGAGGFPGTPPGGVPPLPPRPVMPPPQPIRPGFPPAGGQPLTPSWAARPGYGAPYRPPVKKSNTGLVVAIVLSVVGLLGIGTVGVIASTYKPTRLASSDLTTYPTVSGYSPNPTDDTTTEDTTTRGTTRTTAGRTTSRTTQSTNAGPRPVLKTGDNPLNYNLSAAAVTCNLPRFDTSPAGQDAFYRAALPCLDAAWQPVMQKAGLPFFPVKLQTITEDVSTPCGTRSATRETSLYCDGTIYMTAPYYSDNEQLGNYPGKYLGVLAHEYGHHVQNMSGILQAQASQVYDAGGADTEKGLEISRRKELQASCFSAMFMAAAQGRGSIDANIAQEAVDDESQRGDWPQYPRRDHGTPELNNAWVHQGFRTNSTQQCNTWLADAQSVA